MANEKRIAIILDVDDTLYDQYSIFEKAYYKSKIHKYNIKDLKCLYVKFRYFSDQMFEDSENGVITKEVMHIKRIKLAAKNQGLTISKIEALEFQQAYVKEQERISIDSNANKILQYGLKSNIPMGIITNGPLEHQKRKIKQLNLEKFIDADKIIISSEVNCSKPSSKIFRLCEERFTDKDLDFIMVGDSYKNDIMGASAAKWKSIWINKYNEVATNETKPQYITKTTFGAFKLIKDINEKCKRN